MSVARLYRVGSPFNGAELSELDVEQSADTMYMAHLNHAPTKLVRAGHTDWTFSSIAFTPTIAAPGSVTATATAANTDAGGTPPGDAYFPQPASYVVTAVDDLTGQESRPSSAATATNDLTLKRNSNAIGWGAVTGATRYRVYKADNTQEYGYIGSTATAGFVDDNIGPNYADGPPVGYNPFDSTDNYPSTVTFFEQRLLWGRTNNHPNAIWGSRSGSFEIMDISRPLKASDSFSFSLVAGRVNAVNQLVSMKELLALTSDAIFKIEGGQNGYVSATDFVSRRQNGRGSSRLSPLVIDSVCFYQTGIGNGVRTLGYEFSTDSVNSNDVTIFSPHLFRGFNVVSWAYAQEPRSIIWAVRSDGRLLCFTWEQEQQVWGWTLCETDGLVESVCVISEGGEDRLYLTVRRGEKLLIERMAAARWDTVENSCFLDSAVTYAFETPQAVLRNLDHLEGKTVQALADGAVVTTGPDGLPLVVTDGVVELEYAATTVTAGLPFTATIETLPLAYQAPGGGWTIGKVQTQSGIALRLIDTRGIKVGPNDARLHLLKSRINEPAGSPPSLMTGIYTALLDCAINDGARVVVQSSDPLPMTVSAVYLDPSVSQ